jgi:hypothetical protein
MEKQADSEWRGNFEERLLGQDWDKGGRYHNEAITKMLLALLDSDNWQKDRGDDAIFTVEGRVLREGETLGEELWWTFWHQNTRYPETLVAVPLLSEMLPHVASDNQPFLIDYLMNIALGATDWHLEHGFRPALTRGAYMDDKLGIDLHAAVQEHSVPRFLELARTSPHPRTRAAALWALGWFPALCKDTIPLLQHAAGHDGDGIVRDGAQFAFRMLEKAENQPQDLDDSDWGDPDGELEKEHFDLLMRLNGYNPD